MPAVTIAPADEACQALVTWINAATTYTLPTAATYSYLTIEELSDVDSLSVVVCHISEKTLDDTFDNECPTVHEIIVWVRDKLANAGPVAIAAANLTFRKIYQRINAYRTAANRVKVNDCGYIKAENPDKDLLQTQLIYKAGIVLTVEVDPPA